MSRHVAILLALALLSASSLALPFPVSAAPRTIVVPDDFQTITAAINAASSGDTVFVRSGIHEGPVNQTLVIDKSISIVGEEAESTTISLHPNYVYIDMFPEGYNSYDDSMLISGNQVNVENLTLKGNGPILATGDSIEFKGNILGYFTTAAIIIRGENCVFSRNNGVETYVYLEGSSSTVRQNTFRQLNLRSASHSVIELNRLTSPIIFGLSLVSSENNTISRNTICGETQMSASHNNSFEGNSITDLRLSNSNNNVFAKNNITSHYSSHDDISELDSWMVSVWSIAASDSSNNLFCFNSIANVIIDDELSKDNMFYANSFVGPSLDDGIVRISEVKINNNYWDNGSIGNYWSDYLTKYPGASEIGNSGIGNTPYIVSPSTSEWDPIAYIDHFPLMFPLGRWDISLSSPENQSYSGSVPLVFVVDRSCSWFGYSLDGQENVTVSGNTTISGLAEGWHTVTVYANDTLGNAGASETISLLVDTQAALFQTLLVAVAIAAVTVGAGLLLYFKRSRQKKRY